jgi:hypothetical protein
MKTAYSVTPFLDDLLQWVVSAIPVAHAQQDAGGAYPAASFPVHHLLTFAQICTSD